MSSPDPHSNPVKLNDALLSSLCQQYVYINHTHGISVFMGSFQGRWWNGKNKYLMFIPLSWKSSSFFFFFFTRRHANHANAIFKIYPEYISHCLHLGHVTLVSLQDRCRQTTEQSIRLFEHANQVLSKFSSGFPSLPTFIKHFCLIYFASLWTIWKWVGNMILIPKYSRMLSWH